MITPEILQKFMQEAKKRRIYAQQEMLRADGAVDVLQKLAQQDAIIPDKKETEHGAATT